MKAAMAMAILVPVVFLAILSVAASASHAELSPIMHIVQDLFFGFCPGGILLLAYGDWVYAPLQFLGIVVALNIAYYSVLATFIWLGFKYHRAFWIPVALVVPLLIALGLKI